MKRPILLVLAVLFAAVACHDASTSTKIVEFRGDVTNVMDYDPIAHIWDHGLGEYDHIYHESDVRAGSFVAVYNPIDSAKNGFFSGGSFQVGDTLFAYRFKKWVYWNYGTSPCGTNGPKDITSPGFTIPPYWPQGQSPTACWAHQIRLDYSIYRAHTYSSGGGGGQWTPTAYATIYGPSSVKPGASCYWYVSHTINDSPQFAWRVDSLIGTNQDLWRTNGGSTFTLTVDVFNEDGIGVTAAKEVSVSSEAPDCYVE